MTTFLEDPRLRQRWNEISHNAEAVTENAAANIWTFSHNYISPCIETVSHTVEECLTPCLGDPEERALRAAQRRRRAEYSFDFYDDWEADEYGPEFDSSVGIRSGLLASWGGEDWDRLLAGTGTTRGRGTQEGVEHNQPRRKQGMNYGTRGVRRKVSGEQDDPTIIPSTAPLGFLARLPWKISRTLRYRPSAADLQEHVGTIRSHPNETAPLLGGRSDEDESGESDLLFRSSGRKRSGTTGSGDTSDSFRSRGDLFPSDGEGDEDAVPLDDDFTMPLDSANDLQSSSGKSRSSKGKRPANFARLSRTVSRTTIGSSHSKLSMGSRNFSGLSLEPQTPSLLEREVALVGNMMAHEDGGGEGGDGIPRNDVDHLRVGRKRAAAARLAVAQAFANATSTKHRREVGSEPKPDASEDGHDREGEHKVDSPMAPQKPAVYETRLEGFELGEDEESEIEDVGNADGEHGPRSSQPQLQAQPQSSPLRERISSWIGIPNGSTTSSPPPENEFIPARLPNFR